MHEIRSPTLTFHACWVQTATPLSTIINLYKPSPRMWGNRLSVRRLTRARRTIPTHVRKTASSDALPFMPTDHPHACGENMVDAQIRERAFGPSPRMWGKPWMETRRTRCRRTIPTHVGKTRRKIRRHVDISDHPHACGENEPPPIIKKTNLGPSPRMWGKLTNARHLLQMRRTIPTHVGKTRRRRIISNLRSDHPHACGENIISITKSKLKNEPSPRMWGKPRFRRILAASTRTIPTHVGKTTVPPLPAGRYANHPHACGENLPPLERHGCVYEPSPRMWGKHYILNK